MGTMGCSPIAIKKIRIKQICDIPFRQTNFLDVKRNTTLKTEKIRSKSFGRKVNQEHISIVTETGSTFIGNFTPETGSAKIIFIRNL